MYSVTEFMTVVPFGSWLRSKVDLTSSSTKSSKLSCAPPVVWFGNYSTFILQLFKN